MKLQVLIIVLCLVLCKAADEIKPKERPCKFALKCSLLDDPAWATDGKKCYVFRNQCHLTNDNCQRQNRYEPVLEAISKEQCQNLCNPSCPDVEKVICGYYNDEKREFSNQCLMDYHICSTGETYSIYNQGQCEEPLSLSAS